MKQRTWVILGATSIIAEEFAECVAREGNSLLLVGRNKTQLDIISTNITLRHAVHCDVLPIDLSNNIHPLLIQLKHLNNIDLFIAHSVMLNNDKLNDNNIAELININVTNTIRLIHAYWHKKQTQHRLLFISSVAAERGRSKNSLYGASKAAVEVYLEGLQQTASSHQHITIARLGYIDTHTTYGQPGIFYASPPKACALACFRALQSKKRRIYHPFFWHFIMSIITHLPFIIYKRMGGL
jgi:short-subunit dehydrogenase